MRFTPEHGHQILGGNKKTHRLPIPPRTPADPDQCPHQPGDLLTLHFPELQLDSYGQIILDGHGEPKKKLAHDARLRIQTVTVEPLERVTPQQAKAEGHASDFAFFDWWARTHHDRNWLEDHELNRPVWVLAFTVEYADTERLLARVAGYTSSLHMAIDDLHVVSELDLQVAAELADRKRRDQDKINAQAREQLRLEERIRQLHATADVKGLVLRDEWQVLRAMVKRGDKPAADRAVRNIERVVYPKAA